MNLTFSEILNISNCPIEYVGEKENLDKQIQGFSINSKEVQPDQIFIAIKGERFDGHQFVAEVLAKGVKNCLVSRTWYRNQDHANISGNFFIVEDTLLALQEISRYYRLKFDIPLLALTGSNGKTTTKEMIAAVLEQKYRLLKSEGNLNNHIGVPLTLFKLNTDHELAVTEMGTNHPGEIARLAEIACPTHGLITNIGPAHLEFFGSLEGVFKAKTELWRYLEKQGGTVFLNMDDKFLRQYIPAVGKVITYGFENPADVQGQFTGMSDKGNARFRINGVEINLQIAGMHNIYNALAATAVGLEFGLTLEQIKIALEKFKPADKRMEIIENNGIVIINDCYNSNPESVKKSLLTLSQMGTKGRRIAVLADMFELGDWGEKEHRAVGEFVSSLKNIDWLLTHGQLSALTADSAKKTGMKNTVHFDEKKKLIDYLKSLIKTGDLLLIKGSRGMAMEEVTQALLRS